MESREKREEKRPVRALRLESDDVDCVSLKPGLGRSFGKTICKAAKKRDESASAKPSVVVDKD